MRRFFAFCAGIAIFSAGWFFREIFFNRLLCFMDLAHYFYPYRIFMVESVKRLNFPFWNPYIYFGFPFFATLQHGLFYPLSIIYFVFPFDLAFNLFLIVHYPLAAIFMYLYLRESGVSYWARIFGAITFAFSGYLMSVLHMPTSLQSVIWLPLVFLFWQRIILGKTERANFIALVILFAIMFLGGEPTVLYGTIMFMLLYAIFYPNAVRNILFLVAAAAVSLLLSAIQLFPFIELINNSVRVGGLSFYEATQWSMTPQRIIEFFVPYFFHMTTLPWVSMLWLKSLYLGVVPVVLAGAAFLMEDKRIRNFLLCGLVLSLVLAMGKYTPIYGLLFNILPGLSQIRFPAKFLFLTTFFLSIMSSYGFDILRRRKVKHYGSILIGIGVLFMLISAAGYMHPQKFYQLARPLYFEEINSGQEFQAHAMVLRNVLNIGISGVFILLSGVILYFERLILLLVPLLIIDLSLSSWGEYLSIKTEDYHILSPNIILLQNDHSKFRVFSSPELVRKGKYETSDETLYYRSGLISIRDRISPNQNMLFKIEHSQGYESIHGAGQEALLDRIYKMQDLRAFSVLNGLNIKYLLSPYPISIPGYKKLSKRPENIRGGSIYLFQNMNVLPREYNVPSFKVIKDREKLLDYMFSGKFNIKEAVLLEEEPPACDHFYYVCESYYPGWKAYVDGKEVKIMRANYIFRAVPVPAGKHTVAFAYDPISFKLGAMVSIFAIFGLAVFAFYPRKERG